MEKILLVTVLLVSGLTVKHADAQLRISVNLNIGNQPAWGPTGYDRADYYYMPDIDTYYSVNNHDYIYNSGNRWVHAGSLPPRYANYDLYNSYKVVINEPNPWNRAATYRARYANYRGRRGQAVIRDSRDERYRGYWKGNKRDNGRGNGYGPGRGPRNERPGHGPGGPGHGPGRPDHGPDKRGHGHH